MSKWSQGDGFWTKIKTVAGKTVITIDSDDTNSHPFIGGVILLFFVFWAIGGLFKSCLSEEKQVEENISVSPSPKPPERILAKHETETISVPEKNIALEEIRIRPKEKLFRKKPKEPYVSFDDYLKKQKKLAKNNAKKKQKKNKRFVGNATLLIGREKYTLGSIIVDTVGCSYKVIRGDDPRHQTEYEYNFEASIYEALKEHRLKKHPTGQCPNDRRIVD